MVMNFRGELVGMKACSPAIEWVQGRTEEQAWAECERPDWMIWLAARRGVRLELLVEAAIRCAQRVGTDVDWNTWADRWLSGVDRSAQSAAAMSERGWTLVELLWTDSPLVERRVSQTIYRAAAWAANAALAAAGEEETRRVMAGEASWAAAAEAAEVAEATKLSSLGADIVRNTIGYPFKAN